MPHIDYYFVTVSPWAYLAGGRLEEIAEKHGASITYKPVDFNRVLAATGGLPLAERPEARKQYRLQELRRASAKLGVPLNIQPAHFPTNPAPSSYAIVAAQKAGGEVGALVRAVLTACWAEDRNIAEDDVIRDCLQATGFDPGLAVTGMLAGAEAYARNTDEAIAAGVFGSPFYVVDGSEKFWGQDRLEDLDLFLSGRL